MQVFFHRNLFFSVEVELLWPSSKEFNYSIEIVHIKLLPAKPIPNAYRCTVWGIVFFFLMLLHKQLENSNFKDRMLAVVWWVDPHVQIVDSNNFTKASLSNSLHPDCWKAFLFRAIKLSTHVSFSTDILCCYRAYGKKIITNWQNIPAWNFSAESASQFFIFCFL